MKSNLFTRDLTIVVPLLLTAIPVLTSSAVHASSVFVGYSSTERLVSGNNVAQELSPSGIDLYLSLDLNEQWSLNGNFSKLDDQDSANNTISFEYETESQGLGVSYYADDWAVYYQYTHFEDTQSITSTRLNNNNAAQNTRSDGDSHSVSGSYFLSLNEAWQMNISAGLHYNDWEESNYLIPGNPQQTPLTTRESGNASLVSLSGNLMHYQSLNQNTGLTLGLYLGWNEVLSSDSALNSVNNRNVNQNRGNIGNSNLNNFVVTGSESYGIASVYLSFDFYEVWILDLDTSIDFGAGDSAQSWNINFGYLF